MGTNKTVLNIYAKRLAELYSALATLSDNITKAKGAGNDIPKKDSLIAAAETNVAAIKTIVEAVKDFMPFFDSLCSDAENNSLFKYTQVVPNAGYHPAPTKPEVPDWTLTCKNSEHACGISTSDEDDGSSTAE